jgi:hypothetical protein
MKINLLIILIVSSIGVTFCKREPLDLQDLQNKLNTSPYFEQGKSHFKSYMLYLALISQNDLKSIHDKISSLEPVSLDKIEDELATIPGGIHYLKAQKMFREFQRCESQLTNQFPELKSISQFNRRMLLAPPFDKAESLEFYQQIHHLKQN